MGRHGCELDDSTRVDKEARVPLGPNRIFGPAWAAKVCLVQLSAPSDHLDPALLERSKLEIPNPVTKAWLSLVISWIYDRWADCRPAL